MVFQHHVPVFRSPVKRKTTIMSEIISNQNDEDYDESEVAPEQKLSIATYFIMPVQ